MIIVLRKDATKEQIDHILEKVQEWGLKTNVSRGEERTGIGVIGDVPSAVLAAKHTHPGGTATQIDAQPGAQRLGSGDPSGKPHFDERVGLVGHEPGRDTQAVSGDHEGIGPVATDAPLSLDQRLVQVEVGLAHRLGHVAGNESPEV